VSVAVPSRSIGVRAGNAARSSGFVRARRIDTELGESERGDVINSTASAPSSDQETSTDVIRIAYGAPALAILRGDEPIAATMPPGPRRRDDDDDAPEDDASGVDEFEDEDEAEEAEAEEEEIDDEEDEEDYEDDVDEYEDDDYEDEEEEEEEEEEDDEDYDEDVEDDVADDI